MENSHRKRYICVNDVTFSEIFLCRVLHLCYKVLYEERSHMNECGRTWYDHDDTCVYSGDANMTHTIQDNNFCTVNCTFRGGILSTFILIVNKHGLQIKIYGQKFSTHWASFLTFKTEDDLIFERHISKLSVYDALTQQNATPGVRCVWCMLALINVYDGINCFASR